MIEGLNIEFAKTNKIDAVNEVHEKLTEASNQTRVCQLWGCRKDVAEGSNLLGCDAVLLDEWLTTF